MSVCFEYPKQTAFGRIVPKGRIYDHAKASTILKNRFIDQVERMTWAHKLAPETLNLSATKSVPEIEIIRIRCKQADLHHDILRAIDKAIPYPLIFELIHDGKRKMMAAYKRPNEADTSKWVISSYFSGAWEDEDAPRQVLPQALNLGTLYEAMLTTLMPEFSNAEGPASISEGMSDMPQAVFEAPPPMPQRVARIEEIQTQEREIDRIKARLGRTKQFNKRVEVNGELRDAMQQLEALKRSGRTTH